MSHSSLIARLLLVGALSLAAAPVYAQSNEDRAFTLASEGAELFGQGSYREAAQKFEQAYGLVRDSVLLKNQIVSLYKAGDCASALDLAYTYDISYRDAPQNDKEDVRRVRVDCNLTAAETALDYGKTDVAKESADRAERIGVLGDERARLEKIQQRLTEKPKTSEPPESAVAPSDDPNGWRPIVGFSLLGVGAATAVVTGVLHQQSIARADELNCGAGACNDEQLNEYNDLANSEGVYVAGYAVGGALLLGGAGLLIYHYAIDDAGETAVLPMVGTDSVGATLHITF
ncbi:MAG: hypothetical protein R3E66_07995 [bacterium]